MSERAQVRWNWLVLVGLWVVMYCTFALVAPPLLDDADSVHAEVAREMLLRHDYVTLYANGIRYLEKAPLFYWLMAGSMRVFGVSTWATRVPLAGAVLALALLLESFGRRAWGSARAGLYAGLIGLSSFGIFIFTRINIPDALVCVLLMAALYCFWETEQGGSGRRAAVLFGGALALDVLTKGLIGVVFPVGIVGVYLLLTRGWRGGWRRVGELQPWLAGLVFLVVAAPWHVLIALANPGHGAPGDLHRAAGGHWEVPLPTDGNVHGWAWFYFVNEQVYRYLNVRVPHDYDTAPLWLFLGLIVVWLMPWSAFLPEAIWRAWPRRLRGLGAEEKTCLLLLVWAAVPLVFFSFSTRQEYYVLPSLPPLMLLVARVLGRPAEGGRERAANGFAASVLLGVGVLGAVAVMLFLLRTKAPAATTDLASLLGQNPGDYALSFGHFLDLNAEALGLFRVPLVLTAAALFFGPLLHFFLRRGGRPHGAVLSLAGAAFLFLFAAHLGLRTFAPVLSSEQLAEAIRPQLRAEDMVAIHGEYEAGSTLGFYLLRNDVHIVEGRSSNLWYGSFFPDAPRIFETRESMMEKWRGAQRIFMWEDPQDRERPALLLAPVYVVGVSGGHRILSNQANR